jgi:hypothetical protein
MKGTAYLVVFYVTESHVPQAMRACMWSSGLMGDHGTYLFHWIDGMEPE